MCGLLRRIFVSFMLLMPAFAFAAPPAIQLPRTGQTSCWDANGNVIDCSTPVAVGQDANKAVGVAWPAAPRFTEPTTPNGTLTDKLTDLVWLKNADCLQGPKTFQEALTQANTLANGACGLSDGSAAGQWRLPNVKELVSLTNFQEPVGPDPATPWLISQGFVNVVHDSYYWSSDAYVQTPVQKWIYHTAGDVVPDTGGTNRAFFVRDLLGISVTPATVAFGDAAVGQASTPQTVTIANSGNAPVTVSGITVAGTDSAMFAVALGTGVGACTTLTPTIQPAANCTVNVTFTPATVGAKTASLRVASNADNLPVAESALTGNGIVGTIAVTASVTGGNGTITSTNPASVAQGATASFVVAPAAGFQPSSTVGGTCAAGSFNGNTYTTGAVTAACTVDFSFVANPFTVTFAAGSNGSITGTASQTVSQGGSTTAVTAVPATGFHFVNWTGAGGFASTDNPITLTNVTANQALTANFAATPADTFLVTPTGDEHGTFDPAANQSVNSGSTTTFTVVPKPGYHITDITGCGGTRSGSTYTTGPVTAACTVTATFAENTVSDVLKAFQASLGLAQLTADEKISYDVAPLGADGKPQPDGVVDVGDVVIMLRKLIGVVTW